VNLYFLWSTYTIIWGKGEGGLGIILLPITLSINILLIPAFLNLKKNQEDKLLAPINTLGFIWCFFWLVLFLKN